MTLQTTSQFIPRAPAFLAEYGPDHPMVDERNQPTTLDDGPGCQQVTQAPWPHPLEESMLLSTFQRYIRNHARPKGCNIQRIARSAANIIAFHGPDRHPNTLKQADHRRYGEHRMAQHVKSPTVRRELTSLSAAINFDHAEDRLPSPIKIKMPAGSEPRKRFLTLEEMQRVLDFPMAPRTYMFFVVAFATAARARAIEELTWDRIDFANGLMDFNVPGARKTNKRRALLPIPQDLRPILELAYAARKSEYVIGLSKRGKVACTWKECKAVMRAVGINEHGVARHVARKTWASHALQKGVPMAHVAGVLADRPTTVEKSYGFLLPEHLRNAVNFRLAA